MGWEKVETKNATYILDYSAETSKIGNFPDSPDAIANQITLYARDPKHHLSFPNALVFRIDVEVNKRKRSAVYDKSKAIWSILTISALIAGFKGRHYLIPPAIYIMGFPAWGAVIANAKRGKLNFFQKAFLRSQESILFKLYPRYIKLRDAMMAARLESTVAPNVRKQTGRKPVILVTLGNDHSGIGKMLMKRTMRERTIEKNQRVFGTDYFEREKIGRIFQIKQNPDGSLREEPIESRLPKREMPETKPVKSMNRKLFRMFRPRRALVLLNPFFDGFERAPHDANRAKRVVVGALFSVIGLDDFLQLRNRFLVA